MACPLVIIHSFAGIVGISNSFSVDNKRVSHDGSASHLVFSIFSGGYTIHCHRIKRYSFLRTLCFSLHVASKFRIEFSRVFTSFWNTSLSLSLIFPCHSRIFLSCNFISQNSRSSSIQAIRSSDSSLLVREELVRFPLPYCGL